MGRNVLTCQFVAGLRQPFKEKVVGCDGTFDELLSKARFEEVKTREVIDTHVTHTRNPFTSAGGGGAPVQRRESRRTNSQQSKYDVSCYTCGMRGHISRDCQYKGRSAPVESKGGKPKTRSRPQVATVRSEEDETSSQVQGYKKAARCAELDKALENVSATLHNVTKTGCDTSDQDLGTIPTTTMKIEGMPINALVDTGSPVSIVSLDKLLSACAHLKPPSQTPAEWKEEMRAKIQPPTVTLKNFGGGAIELVGKGNACVARGKYSTHGT